MSGQKEMFMEIWDERPHYSEVSGKYLGEVPLSHFFAHILPKGAYPAYKLNKENIMLMTPQEHALYDHSVPPDNEMWKKVHERFDKLKSEYYSQKKLGRLFL